MRILFVTPYIPSPVRIRPYAFIRELATRGHEVTLVCLVQPAQEEHYLSAVAPYCQAVHPIHLGRWEPYVNCLTSLPTKTPLSVAYCRSRQAQGLVAELAENGNHDLIHTEFARAAPLTANLNGCPKVYDAVDSLALAYRRSLTAEHVSLRRRLVALAEWLKMRSFEPWVSRRFDRVLISSPADQEALARDGSRVTVIPNGVDTEYFALRKGPQDESTLAFLGKMSYYVNVSSILWFYHQILPLVRRQRPDIRLKIVGRDPVASISALAADSAVEVTGSVADVRPHLSSAAVSICPMTTGSGIQNKMLETMALGVPTVATSLACQALAVEPGQDVMVADEPAAFAEAVLRLLEDESLRADLSRNARQYVEKHHNWGEIGCQLESVYHDLHN